MAKTVHRVSMYPTLPPSKDYILYTYSQNQNQELILVQCVCIAICYFNTYV